MNNYFDEDIELEDVDFSEGELDLNWFSKLNKEKSDSIIQNGEKKGEFDNTGATWWNVIKYEGNYYISLADLDDVFEVNKTILERI